MKRIAIILAAVLLAAALLYGCGIIPNADTSIVTITIGDSTNEAVLQAEAATPWTRFRQLLAGVDLVRKADAYIPSVVQAIIVTVTAADLPTPIVAVKTIGNTDTSAAVRIEVPNGTDRHFLVEGYRGIDSQVYFRGTASTDLLGAAVTLPVVMTAAGPGIYVDIVNGSDTLGDGTQANPYATITQALSQTTGTDAIFVRAGNYPPGGAGVGETYPLQLKANNALICLGTNFSTVLDRSAAFGAATIYGAEGASVDNCRIIVATAGKGIDDRQGGTTPLTTGMRINGDLIVLPFTGTFSSMIGADLYSDTPVLESTVTASGGPFFGSETGVQISGGKPSIVGSAVSGLVTGINLAPGAGDALISATSISGNSTGINVQTPNAPKIELSTISNNSIYGIYVSAGNAAISGNVIQGNDTGLDIQAGAAAPVVRSNRLYCNANTDFFSNMSVGLDIGGNAWDHDPSTTPAGPTSFMSVNGEADCGGGAGTDICWQNGLPNFTLNSPAVPSPPACR